MKIRRLTLGGAVESAEELASLEKGRVNRIFFFFAKPDAHCGHISLLRRDTRKVPVADFFSPP